MNEGLHVLLHRLAGRGGELRVVEHDRPGVRAEPVQALADDPVRLAHLLDAHEVTVVAVAVHPDRDVEVDVGVHLVGLLLAKVPLDAGPAQHRPREPELERPLGRHHADADGALLPDPVVGEEGLVLVHAARESVGEALDEVEERALAGAVEALRLAVPAPGRRGVPRHLLREVPVHPARTVVGRVHPGAGNRLVAVHQVLALAERVEEYGHRPDVEPVRPDPHQVVQDAGDLVEHGADPARPQGRLDAEKAFDGEHVGVLVAHHGHVVETVHVADALAVGLGLGELLGGAVQEPDVGVGALDDLPVHLEHEPEHPVRGRVLGAEVEGEVADLGHRRGLRLPRPPLRPRPPPPGRRRGCSAGRAG